MPGTYVRCISKLAFWHVHVDNNRGYGGPIEHEDNAHSRTVAERKGCQLPCPTVAVLVSDQHRVRPTQPACYCYLGIPSCYCRLHLHITHIRA